MPLIHDMEDPFFEVDEPDVVEDDDDEPPRVDPDIEISDNENWFTPAS